MNQPRGTQRYQSTPREDEDALTRAIIELASQYGRYGYRRITALLRRVGWQVGKDRVERIWRREGLKVPQKQKPRGRLWLHDGSCVRLRPMHENHVWSYDFVSARTHDGRSVRLLNLIDESTRECLLIRGERRWSSARVIGALADVMVMKGVPEHLRSDNGPEFVAKDLRKWLADTGAKTLYIEPGFSMGGRLASSIAHEINNPLEAVTNLLYLLNGTPLNAEQQDYLDIAQRELARVSEIAVNTLTFNRRRDVKGQASIAALLDSVLLLYHGRLAGSDTVVEHRYRNAAPLTCYPGELRQVFANLIGNAFDAMRGGGRLLVRERPATHPRTGEDGVRITVADTGEGMSENVKAHLFEAFESTKGSNGSGLGLWISKGIIDKHSGSIQVRSSSRPESSGTVFSLFVPIDLDIKL